MAYKTRGNRTTRAARKAEQRRTRLQRRVWFANGDPYSGAGRKSLMACGAPIGEHSVYGSGGKPMAEGVKAVSTKPSVLARIMARLFRRGK